MTGTESIGASWVDVSVPIRDGMVHYPGDPSVELRHTEHLERGDSATVSHLSFGVHTGTHVDAPVHFIVGAPGVDTIPIDSMIGPARIIEIRQKETCTAEDLMPHGIAPGERILLRTDNSDRCWSVDTFVDDYAHLDVSAARLLAERRVRLVGIDYLSVGGGEDGPEVHRILLGAGIVIVEGLNLSPVGPGLYDLVCLPLKILGGDGAPARVAVRLTHPTGAPGCATRPGAAARR